MEVVTIEKRTFSYVCERFTEFAKRIESLCSTHTQKVENWLDSQELLQTVKHKINHPNKSRIMKRTKEDYPSFNLFSIGRYMGKC